jgi:putative phage-type endonuclease
MARLAVERLTGHQEENYVNAAMLHGIETEPEARSAYVFYYDADVEETGIVLHPSIQRTHASPDGLVGKDGLVEIKCPNSATHLDFLLTEAIPDKYIVQMLWQMACTGRAWCDFASYDPRFPEDMRLRVKRVHRDIERINALEDEVRAFMAELDAKLAKLIPKEITGAYSPSIPSQENAA